MPRFDGTGPRGQGPMTGQGMGFCVLKESQNTPGNMEGFIGMQGMPIGPYNCGSFYTSARLVYGRHFGRGRAFRGGRGRLGR